MSTASLVYRLFDPHTEKFILEASGEAKVSEIHKHWLVHVWPVFRVLVGFLIIASVLLYDYPLIFWAGLLLGMVISLQGAWRMLGEYRDRFVITNQRVFRLNGVIRQRRASVPLLRILDITSDKTFWGRILGYGHFVFESAAQVQGLSKITFVKDIDTVEDALRMVMQGEQSMVTLGPLDPDDN